MTYCTSAHIFLANTINAYCRHDTAFLAHVVIDAGRWGDADAIKTQIKDRISGRFDIHHSTLELECAQHACVTPAEIGAGDA